MRSHNSRWLERINALHLFLAGVVIHLAVVAIVLTNSSSRMEGLFYKDDGTLVEKLSAITFDSKSYAEAADNYLVHGTFGQGDNIDHCRTIGYPVFIAVFKWMFGDHWFQALVIAQAILSAFIYPALFYIGKILIGKERGVVLIGVLFMMLSGTFFVRVAFVMTDLLFVTFFFLGIYASLKAVVEGSWVYFFISVILISYSALIRPTLSFYPLVHLLMLLHVARKYDHWKAKPKRLVLLSFVILAATCNISSLRMYNAYGVFGPSDVLGINMFEYTTKVILERNQQQDIYACYLKEINAAPDFIVQRSLRKKFFMETVKAYPGDAAAYWMEVAVSHLLTPHFMTLGSLHGVTKKDSLSIGGDGKVTPLKRSRFIQVVYYFFLLVFLMLVFVPFLLSCLKLLRRKEFVLVLWLVTYIGLFIGPTLLADGSERFRMPVEPIMVFYGLIYLRENYVDGKLQMTYWLETVFKRAKNVKV